MSDLLLRPTAVSFEGTSALIRNLGRSCTPEQYLREFLKNSIEACERSNAKGQKIIVDFNETILKTTGHYKLSFADNGDGMTPAQMLELLNNLSTSGTSNEMSNYGLGAKISAMTRNHAGILYESWRGGVGASILICYMPEVDSYGIKGFRKGKKIIYARPVEPSQKPDIISEHGTRVTLFGMVNEQDTMLPPEGVRQNKDVWIANILGQRFFILPKGIEIQVRMGYQHPISNPKKHYLKRLVGLSDQLTASSAAQGEVMLQGAKVYWWILKEGVTFAFQCALVNGGEVFNLKKSSENPLSPFGISLNRHRVVLFIEPNEAIQNTGRTVILEKSGANFDWGVWQDEFRGKMPEEILRLTNDLDNEVATKSNAASINERLSDLTDLYQMSNFQDLPPPKRPKSAPAPIEAPSPVNSTKDTASNYQEVQEQAQNAAQSLESKPPGIETPPPAGSSVPNQTEEPPKLAPPYASAPLSEMDNKFEDLSKEGASHLDDKALSEVVPEPTTAKPKPLKYFPRVMWTNEKESPFLKNFAAEYNPDLQMVLANVDFKGVVDLKNYFLAKYGDGDEVAHLIAGAVHESSEQLLMEVVAGVISLTAGSSPIWKKEDAIKNALSKSALTANMMQRYWVTKNIDQLIKEKLSIPFHRQTN